MLVVALAAVVMAGHTAGEQNDPRTAALEQQRVDAAGAVSSIFSASRPTT